MQEALLWGRHIRPAFRWGISHFSSPVLHTAPAPSSPRPRVLPLGGTQGSLTDSGLAQALPYPTLLVWVGSSQMAPVPAPPLPSPSPLPPRPLPTFGILAFQASQSTPVKSHPGKSGFLLEDHDINKRGPPPKGGKC